ncbi:MAG: PilZ domain-containing protein [SAR324 cluster bacterium]|nr:PilZ domain-containing protein [SAR324 cluster bacterium]
MITVKGHYEDGKIKLSKPLILEENSDVIITFLDPEDGASIAKEEKDEAYYEGLRAHKRFAATGDIHIVTETGERAYPLNDYSSGGLSFFSEHVFDSDTSITATFKYNAAGEILVMEFEIQVRRSIEDDDKYMIGCQFIDNVDEELWHTVMGS